MIGAGHDPMFSAGRRPAATRQADGNPPARAERGGPLMMAAGFLGPPRGPAGLLAHGRQRPGHGPPRVTEIGTTTGRRVRMRSTAR